MRRHVLTILIFLLAGAAVNVVVAWVLAIRITPVSPFQIVGTYEGVYEGVDNSQWWWCQVLVRQGHEQVAWERVRVDKVPTGYTNEIVWERGHVLDLPRAHSTEVVVEVHDVVRSDLLDSWLLRRIGWFRSQGTDPKDYLSRLRGVVAKPPTAMDLLAPQKILSRRVDQDAIRRVDQDAIPSWAGSPQSIESGGGVRSAFGWPRVAMWHERLLTVKSGQQVVTGGGLRLADGFQFLGQGRILPYRVIASGFALNTIIYAAILWPLICGPFVIHRRIRRRIRRRRGLCPTCAYPMGASAVCTECGKPLPGGAGAAS